MRQRVFRRTFCSCQGVGTRFVSKGVSWLLAPRSTFDADPAICDAAVAACEAAGEFGPAHSVLSRMDTPALLQQLRQEKEICFRVGPNSV